MSDKWQNNHSFCLVKDKCLRKQFENIHYQICNVQLRAVSDLDWILDSIIFTFRIWIRYGVYKKVSHWIRIAKFPYLHTTVNVHW